MTDAMQWLIDLLIGDVGRLVVGLLILATVFEFIFKFKEWIS